MDTWIHSYIHTLPYLTLPYLTSPHFTSPYLTHRYTHIYIYMVYPNHQKTQWIWYFIGIDCLICFSNWICVKMGDAGDAPKLWLAIIKFRGILLSPRSICCKVSLLQLVKGKISWFLGQDGQNHPVGLLNQSIDLWWFGD